MLKRFGFALVVAAFTQLAPYAQAADDVAAIIDKAIQANGGEAKMSKALAATWKTKGTVHVMGLDIVHTSDDAFQAPDRFRTAIEGEIMGNKFNVVVVVNGNKGWRNIMGQTMELTGDELTEIRERAYSHWCNRLTPLKDKAFTLSSIGEVQVDGKPAVGVKVSHKGHADINLFFDKESHLLVKVQQRLKDPMSGQEMDHQAFYSDFKDTPGGKHATKVKVKRDGQPYVEAEVTDIQAVDKLDDKLFEEPK